MQCRSSTGLFSSMEVACQPTGSEVSQVTQRASSRDLQVRSNRAESQQGQSHTASEPSGACPKSKDRRAQVPATVRTLEQFAREIRSQSCSQTQVRSALASRFPGARVHPRVSRTSQSNSQYPT
uniref:Uncharacterized protein n=1 Tax=Knipowitschia caucasica TaxID=637954 RepID=A0AAV2KRA6_KNICA